MTADDLEQLNAQYRKDQSTATQDAATSSVNATNRIFSRTPGVGAPGSTPETDQTNLNLAAAMDRGDAFNRGVQPAATQPQPDQGGGIDIAAVNARRNQILQGIDPDKPAIYPSDIAPRGGGSSRRAELYHELGTLTNIVHENSLTTAAQAHQDLIKQRTIDVANGSTNIFNGLQKILPNGTPESEQAVQSLIGQNRLAFDASPAVREEVLRHTKAHDAAASAQAGSQPFTPPDGMQLSHVVQDSAGKSHAVFVPTPDTSTYSSKEDLIAKNPDAKPKQNSKGGWYDSGEVKHVPDKVVEEVGKLSAAQANSQFYLGKETVPATQAKIKDEMAQRNTQLESWYQSFPSLRPNSATTQTSTTPAAAAAPPPNLDALANKALADPNAPENVKAAARKRLGK
jgi:hypothetical protein